MSKKIIYTAIFDEYDILIDPDYVTPGWEYICFTNNREFESNIWTIKYIEPQLDLTRSARQIKIKPYEYLNEYDICIWVDGNINISYNLDEFVDNYIDSEADLAISMHPIRDCIYQEINACIDLKKDNKDVLVKYKNFLLSNNYPEFNGLVQTGVIIRKNSDSIKEFCDEWWLYVFEYSKRDQLSFNYVLEKIPIKYTLFSSDIFIDKFILYFHAEKNKMIKTNFNKSYGKNFYLKYNNKDFFKNNITIVNNKFSIKNKYNIKNDKSLLYTNDIKHNNIAYILHTVNHDDSINKIVNSSSYDFIVTIMKDLEEINENLLNIKNIKQLKSLRLIMFDVIKNKFKDMNVSFNILKKIYTMNVKQLYALNFDYLMIKYIEEINNSKYDIIVFSTNVELLDINAINNINFENNNIYFYKRSYWIGHRKEMSEFFRVFQNLNDYNTKTSFFDNVNKYLKTININIIKI